jgi:hypothetical protein
MTSKTEASIQHEKKISTLAKRIADLEQQRSRAALEGDGYRACQLVDAIRRDTLTWQGLVQARASSQPAGDRVRPNGQYFDGSHS